MEIDFENCKETLLPNFYICRDQRGDLLVSVNINAEPLLSEEQVKAVGRAAAWAYQTILKGEPK